MEHLIKEAEKVVAMDATTANQCMMKLCNTKFSQEQRNSICSIIQQKRIADNAPEQSLALTSHGGKRFLQTNLHSQHWLPTTLFHLLGSASGDMNDKLSLIIKLCVGTGMVYLNEASLVHLLAVWLMIECGGKDVLLAQIDHALAFHRLNMLKNGIRSVRKKFNYKWSGQITSYPEHPEALNEHFPEAYTLTYGEDPPMKWPYDGLADHVGEGRTLHTIFTRCSCFQGASAPQPQPQCP